MHLSALPLLRVLVASALFCAIATSVAAQDSVSTQQSRIQHIVDRISAQLGIAEPVRVSIVPSNRLLMSVEPAEHFFELKVEDGFVHGLGDAELTAAVAHELGHVWIFTHHPFLQTEQLANEVAMRLVERDVLAQLYDKVWKQVGFKGDLDRFLGAAPVRGLASPDDVPASSDDLPASPTP
jgi:hypothetical protein